MKGIYKHKIVGKDSKPSYIKIERKVHGWWTGLSIATHHETGEPIKEQKGEYKTIPGTNVTISDESLQAWCEKVD